MVLDELIDVARGVARDVARGVARDVGSGVARDVGSGATFGSEEGLVSR